MRAMLAPGGMGDHVLSHKDHQEALFVKLALDLWYECWERSRLEGGFAGDVLAPETEGDGRRPGPEVAKDEVWEEVTPA